MIFWRLPVAAEPVTVDCRPALNFVSFHKNDLNFITWADKSLNVRDSETGNAVLRGDDITNRYIGTNASLSPDGRYLSAGMNADLHDVYAGKRIATLYPTGIVFAARFNAGGTKLAKAASDSEARIWDLKTLQPGRRCATRRAP